MCGYFKKDIKYVLEFAIFVDLMICYKELACFILFTNYFIIRSCIRSNMFTSSSSVIIYKAPLMHREVIKSNQPLKHIYLDEINEIRIICVLFFRLQEMLQRLYFEKLHIFGLLPVHHLKSHMLIVHHCE